MSESPVVSVAVTVYNRERYLPDCLESVLASTWRNFEVVLVDDCSSDNSFEVARRFASNDPRIRISRNEHNLGDYRNRMRAAELARGRYLKYVDSDDLIYSHSLEIMVEAMETNRDAALGLCHSLPEDESPYPWKLEPASSWRKEFLGDGCFGSGPSGAIIDRERFIEIGGFREWGVLSDADLWYRMSAKWPIMLLPPGLVWWRRHAQQEFSKDSAAAVYLERGFALSLDALSSPENPLSDAERKSAVARAKQHHARRLIALALRRGRPALAFRLMRQSGLDPSELAQGLAKYQ